MDINKRKLVVNYLPEMSDEELKILFESIGRVRFVKIVRHGNNGPSKGFAFVEYACPWDAATAIQVLNGHQLVNKKIKVAYCRPGGDYLQNACLHLRGIPKNMTEEKLRSIFSKFGQIIQCRLLKDDSGIRNTGIGFVHFDQRSQAELAIDKMNGEVLEGGTKSLLISHSIGQAKAVIYPKSNQQLSIKDLHVDLFAASMEERYGSVHQNSLRGPYRYDSKTGYMGSSNKGYGCSSAPAPRKPDVEDKGHVLFVYNIGPHTNEKTIIQLFVRYGPVVKVKIMREEGTGRGKNFCFVTMLNYNDALIAIKSLNGSVVFEKPLQLSFKKN